MKNSNKKISEIYKILIVHTWGIGDLIMFTPALKVLRENFPKAKIDIFVTSTEGVLQANHLINKTIKFDFKKSNLFNKLKFIYKLRKEKYDMSIVTTGINPFKGSLFTFLIGVRIRVGEYKKLKLPLYTHQVKINENQHKINTNLNLLRTLNIKIDNFERPFFEIGITEKNFAQNFIQENSLKDKLLVGFFPGSSFEQRFKRWPKENFIELGKKILTNFPNTFILLFGGSNEDKSICTEIQRKLNGNSKQVINYPLKEVAALIDQCEIFVTSDTGLGHIAATTKTNLISIFGPTDPGRSGPIGQKVYMIKETCTYPYHDVITPKYDTKRVHRCLKKITPERVFNKIKEIFKKKINKIII